MFDGDSYRRCSRRVVRHEDQKSFCTNSDADSAKASQTRDEKKHSQSIGHGFAEAKKSFADSVSHSYAEGEIKAQKGISYAIFISDRHAGGNAVSKSGRNATTFSDAIAWYAPDSREKSLAQRQSFPR